MEKSNINFKPIGEKILVDAHPPETKVNGIIRVTDLEQNRKGTVVATNSDTNLSKRCGCICSHCCCVYHY